MKGRFVIKQLKIWGFLSIICDLIIPCEENHKRYFDFQRRTGDLPVQKEKGGTHTSRNLFKHWCS
ncbi:putative (E)-4-hydroxy-3-methylbut-2-enyl-diphosphate synthase (ferredoxin) [Helianthus anomalus]